MTHPPRPQDLSRVRAPRMGHSFPEEMQQIQWALVDEVEMEKFGEPKRTAPSVTPDHQQPSSATSGKPPSPQHSACSPFSRGDTPVSMLHSRHQGRQAIQTRSVGPKARGAGCAVDGTDHHDKAGVVEDGAR